MNFQACLENTFRMIKAEPIILILGGLIVQLLTILTMGILVGPFLGGYFLLIIYYLRENRKPVFNDIFSGLQQFANLLPYFFVLLTILIGFMLLILPGFVLATWWIYVLPLMVDRKISFSEAMKISTKKVNETGFFMHLAFLLLISVLPIILLNFLSAMMPFLFVLKLLLPPFQVGCLASLYVDQFKEIEEETAPIHEEEPAEAVPENLPLAEETGDQVKEESIQPEQPVSEETETSDQSVTESFPEENVPDEKPDQVDDNHPGKAEEADVDSEKDNKDTV
jgi:hypothetical protein